MFREHRSVHIGWPFRVESAGKVFCQNGTYALTDVFGIWTGGEGVPVSYEEIAIVFILHFQEALDGTKVVAQMKMSQGSAGMLSTIAQE